MNRRLFPVTPHLTLTLTRLPSESEGILFTFNMSAGAVGVFLHRDAAALFITNYYHFETYIEQTVCRLEKEFCKIPPWSSFQGAEAGRVRAEEDIVARAPSAAESEAEARLREDRMNYLAVFYF